MTTHIITLKDLWKAYKKTHVPAAAGAAQTSATEHAFYAGAHNAIYAMFDSKLTASAQDAAALLESFRAEIAEYRKLRATMRGDEK
jgi:hypothetical protein